MTISDLERTRRVGRNLAERTSELIGESIQFREYPAHGVGNNPFVLLELSREPHRYALGAATCQDGQSHVDIVSVRDDQLGVIRFSLRSNDEYRDCASAIADYVRSGLMPNAPPNAIGTAFEFADALNQTVYVGGGSWQTKTTTRVGTTTIDLAGSPPIQWRDVVEFVQIPDGVDVSILGATMHSPNVLFELRAAAQFSMATSAMVECVRSAMMGRDAFRNRPFKVDDVGRRILERLEEATWISGKLQRDHLEYSGEMRGCPSDVISRIDDRGKHEYVRCRESRDGVTVIAGAFERVLTSMHELETALPDVLRAVEREQSRLTPDKLRRGQRYEVMTHVEFNGSSLTPGTVLEFVNSEFDPRNGFETFHFRVLGSHVSDLDLAGDFTRNLQLLGDMDRWLRRC